MQATKSSGRSTHRVNLRFSARHAEASKGHRVWHKQVPREALPRSACIRPRLPMGCQWIVGWDRWDIGHLRFHPGDHTTQNGDTVH